MPFAAISSASEEANGRPGGGLCDVNGPCRKPLNPLSIADAVLESCSIAGTFLHAAQVLASARDERGSHSAAEFMGGDSSCRLKSRRVIRAFKPSFDWIV